MNKLKKKKDLNELQCFKRQKTLVKDLNSKESQSEWPIFVNHALFGLFSACNEKK